MKLSTLVRNEDHYKKIWKIIFELEDIQQTSVMILGVVEKWSKGHFQMK